MKIKYDSSLINTGTGTFVNRKDNKYHLKRMNDVSNLDLVAITLLQIMHSYRSSYGGLIHYDCVAVCMVGQDLWVASNSQRLNIYDLHALNETLLLDGYIFRYIFIVTNGYKHMHAEMQLLQQLIDENVLTVDMIFGVSKPCCLCCKNILDQYHIYYTHYHDSIVKNWIPLSLPKK